MTRVNFPAGFLWGTATAAHQVEGNNLNNDSWLMEHLPGTIYAEPSGDACDHYHRYAGDIALLAELGFNLYRFSIEWARVEPEEGEFSSAELDHYRRMLAACHEHHITPLVTFHHFTTPRWIMKHRRLGRCGHARKIRALLRTRHAPSGRSDRRGLHHQRGQHRDAADKRGRTPASRSLAAGAVVEGRRSSSGHYASQLCAL